MNDVLAWIPLVLASLNSHLIGTVILFCGIMPNKIILTILLRPNWDKDTWNTAWIRQVGDKNIKGSTIFIIIGNS